MSIAGTLPCTCCITSLTPPGKRSDKRELSFHAASGSTATSCCIDMLSTDSCMGATPHACFSTVLSIMTLPATSHAYRFHNLPSACDCLYRSRASGLLAKYTSHAVSLSSLLRSPYSSSIHRTCIRSWNRFGCAPTHSSRNENWAPNVVGSPCGFRAYCSS